MSILRDAINRIAELSEPTISLIGSKHYADKTMQMFHDNDEISMISSCSLSSISEYAEQYDDETFFLLINDHTTITLFTQDLTERKRKYHIRATHPIGNIDFFNKWKSQDNFRLELLNNFVKTPALKKVLSIVSNITECNKLTSEKDDLTKIVTVEKSISLKEQTELETPIELRPYVTFDEIPPPPVLYNIDARKIVDEFEFMLSPSSSSQWMTEVIRNIRDYFNDAENITVL